MTDSDIAVTGAADHNNANPLASRMRRLPRYLRAVIATLDTQRPRTEFLTGIRERLGFDETTAAGFAYRPPFAVPSEGVWKPEQWIGLADAVGPETPPEEALVSLAIRHWMESPNGAHGRVLHWSSDCWFPLALRGTLPNGHSLEVDAVVGNDVPLEGSARRLGRIPEAPLYDLVFLQPAAPSEDPFGPPHPGEPRDCLANDLARMHASAWRERLLDVLALTSRQVLAGGTVILLSPAEIRTGGRPHRGARLSYATSRGLLSGARDRLATQGMNVAVDVLLEPRNTLHRPLYQRRACFWRLIVANRPRLSLAPQTLEAAS